MGQYFTPIIKRENGKFEKFSCYDYNNGAKLMEHSYLGNCFVETVVEQLINKKGHLTWVGDYAEAGMVDSDLDAEFVMEEGNDNSKYSIPQMVSSKQNSLFLIFLNHTKKEYFIPVQCGVKRDKWNMIIHPLPLLTAIGNGQGGGDYHGKCMHLIGGWACNELEVLDKWDDNYKNYTDISKNIKFEEGEEEE